MRPSGVLGVVVVSIALAALPSRGQSGFLPGDVYLHSSFLVNLSATGGGLLRVNPYTGASQLAVSYVASALPSVFGAAAYDPWRNRIIVYAGIDLGPIFNNLAFLSGGGTSQAQLVVPPNAPPVFAGVTVFHAAVAFAPGLVLVHVSNPVALTLTP